MTQVGILLFLEIRSLKSVSLGLSQRVSRAGSFWRLQEESISVPCLQLLRAVSVPWVVVPSSISKVHPSNFCFHHYAAISDSDSSCILRIRTVVITVDP